MRARVLLADDNESILEDMEDLLSSDFEIVGKVRDGLAAVEAATRLLPDLIITDLSMPRLTGMELGRIVLDAKSDIRIVLVTMHLDWDILKRALRTGILGFVDKLSAEKELVPASHAALRGEVFISESCRKLQ